MNQLWSVGNSRDIWGRWTPPAVENLSWLNSVDCFRPRHFIAPNEANRNIPASGYLVSTFALVPGSWWVGLAEVNADVLDFQVTDLTTNYQFFSSPTSCSLAATNGGFCSPYWLPEPYMIHGPALLRVELWNNTTSPTVNSQLVLFVIEPREV